MTLKTFSAFLMLSVVTSTAWAQQTAPKTGIKNLKLPSSCFPDRKPRLELAVTATPNLGSIEPAVLVAAGTKVRLFGVARLVALDVLCHLTTTSVPFTWKLSFQPKGGQLGPVVGLVGASTLTPGFDALNVGVYYAELDAEGKSAVAEIDVEPFDWAWVSIGPNGSVDPQGKGDTSVGRLNTIAFDPLQPSRLYAGSALGGVFASGDQGGKWTAMTDHKGLPTLGIGALAVAVDGTIYAGTGDLHPNDDRIFQPGSGIWMSADHGLTWKAVGTQPANCPQGSVPFTGNATKILAHPAKAKTLYVSALEGLFRSTDGGNCWTQLLDGIVTDIALDSSAPSTLYAAAPRYADPIQKTTNAEAAAPIFAGLKVGLQDTYDYILLALAPSSPRVIYAALATPARTDFFWSPDGGQFWTQGTSVAVCSGQCSYDMALAVSPLDANRVVYGERTVWQSVDRTQDWMEIQPSTVHPDFHAMVFAPDDASMVYAATDGGVFRIQLPPNTNPNPQTGWEARNLEMTIGQAPTLAVAPTTQIASAIGVWDNGTQRRLAGRTWESIWYGDGFVVAIDAVNATTVYLNCNAGDGGEICRSPDGKDLGGAVSFLSNPYKAGELFGVGANGRTGQKFYVTENANTIPSADWRCADPAPSAASAFDIEFLPDGSYYASFTDGSIYHFSLPNNLPVTDCVNGQTNAQNIERIYQVPPGGIPIIALDSSDQKSMYVVNGHDVGADRVFYLTQTNGQWTATPLAGKSGDPGALPSVLTEVQPIMDDPMFPGVVYVGTGHGLWMGRPGANGYTWALDGTVPDTLVMGIVPHRNGNGYSGVLRLTTYGRGVWERRLALRAPVVEPPCPDSFGCLQPYIPIVICISCPMDPFKRLTAEQPQERVSDQQAWLAIPYDFRGARGETAQLQIRLLSNGILQPYFLTEPQTVHAGAGTALVMVRYAARLAPLGLHTDAVRVELIPARSEARAQTRVLSLDKWWARPDANLVTVEARAYDPGEVSLAAELKVELEGRRPLVGTSPYTLAVRQGSSISAQLPACLEANQKVWKLKIWTDNNQVVGGISGKATVTPTGPTHLIAHYEVLGPASRAGIYPHLPSEHVRRRAKEKNALPNER